MKQLNLQKKLLSSSVAAVFTSVASGATFAQDALEEEVVVTGIRGSLERAMDIKREAQGVVDAISAEDMGKFPDSNLAESLQRISGVSIDRSNNEGNQVTVRGFAPEFNMVTLNGRTMPVSSNDRDGAANRAFNFAELASESVSGVEVFKTAKSSHASGGIGSVINIKTAKPFDYDETKIALGLKLVSDTSNVTGDDVTPEVSGLFSINLGDESQIGILIGGSYQLRHNRETIAAVDGWNRSTGRITPEAQASITNTSGSFWIPQNYNIGISDHERERINGNLVLQFAPTEAITLSLDYTYSKFEDEIHRNQLGVWFGANSALAVEANANGTATRVTESGTTDVFGFNDFDITENESFGFNAEFQLTDDLSLTFDAHSSESESNIDPSKPSDQFFIINYANSQELNIGADIPLLTGLNNGPDQLPGTADDIADPLNPSRITPFLSFWNNNSQSTTIDEFRLSGSLALDTGTKVNLTEFNFGVGYLEHDTFVRLQANQQNNATAGGTALTLPDGMFTESTIRGEFSDFSGSEILPNILTFDNEAVIEAITALYADPSVILVGGGGTDAQHKLTEETVSAYVEIKGESELFGMPTNILAGFRYEQTDVTGRSREIPFAALELGTGTEIFERSAEEVAALIATGSANGVVSEQAFSNVASDYAYVLPNIDFSINFFDDVVGRASYSESMARSALENQRATTAVTSSDKGGFRANQGNPGLLPYISENFDLSLEWYYGDSSYVSVGWFKKNVGNFVQTNVVQGDIQGLTDPSAGPRERAAREQLIAAGNASPTDNDIFGQMLANQTAAAATDPSLANLGTIIGNADDPVAIWDISQPVNAEKVNVEGFELAIQHLFGESGFGFQANATWAEPNREFDVEDVGSNFALTGASDSANLVAFYDNHGLQARLAYNWRDDFLLGLGQLRNAQEPTFTESYGQFDLNVSYAVTEEITVFFEGLNITEESSRRHGRYEEQLVQAIAGSARYNVGVRANF